MENLQKIVVLIDADNTQLAKLETVMREVSTYGRIVVKRAYGNWKKTTLKKWEDELKRLSIKAEQQFDYTAGKNATDIALVISAVDLLHTNIYDAFVLVASDSDYTPLAIRLHETGVFVIGVGETKTPESFRNACDNFIFLENLSYADNDKKQNNGKPIVATTKDETNYEENSVADIEPIHSLLKIAFETYQDDDEGFVNVSSAGTYIKRAKPDFDSRTYGYSKLPNLIEAFPEKYEMKKYKGKGTVNIIAYKCLS